METATDTTNTASRDSAPATAGEEADEIRGMMPSFHVWHKAQHALAFERAVATRERDRDDKPRTRRRWPLVLAAVAVVAVALGLEQAGGPSTPEVTATTPVEKMPWRNVDAPSGAFHVSLPDKPRTRSLVNAAGSGVQLELRMQQTTVVVGAFPVSGPSQGHEFVRPVLDERAEELDGRVDSPHPVGSRSGEAFEGFIRTTTTVAVVRVIVDGAMLYVIELRGDVDSARARQIYDRVVLSFTPGT
jgi:hypothetical protein